MDYKIQGLLFSVSFNVLAHAKQNGFVTKFGEELKNKQTKTKPK